MTKRNKKPRQHLANIFDQFGYSIEGGKGRLIKFAEPDEPDESVVNLCIARWLDAIDSFDKGDKSVLVALMKSGMPLPDAVVPHIGDLIDRWNFTRPMGRPRIPSHQMTDADLAMNMADCEVDDLVSSGKSISDAIKEVAARHGIKETVLREYHDKRRSSDRRAKARTYKR